jgi:hypothetical protein
VSYAFGQDIELGFYPLVDNEPAEIPSALQAQTPAIYLYRDLPNKADAATGAGSPLQTITSWTWDSAKNGWTFTVDGIDDPDPTSTGPVNPHWVAINFLLSSGEQSQLVLQALDIQKVAAHLRVLDVTDDDLKALLPQITSHSTAVQRADYTSKATSQVKAKLKARGFEWAMLNRPDELKNAVTYKTLWLFCLAQVQAGNDKFAFKLAAFADLYTTEIDGMPIPIDTDGDGKPDTVAKPQTKTAWVIR